MQVNPLQQVQFMLDLITSKWGAFLRLSACHRLLACWLLMGGYLLETQGAAPNIILMMADDLGWCDVGFNGNRVVHTPHLDALSGDGLIFDRFYAASPVCSPTRGSCLTGRHPARYKISTANAGHILTEETTIAELLASKGYFTGHFGKWHLGTLTQQGKDSNRGGDRNLQHYAPPTAHGFHTYFSTEAKTPTWDSQWAPRKRSQTWWNPVHLLDRVPYGTSYWTPDGRVSEPLPGDDSAMIMQRALEFMEKASEADRPFLAVIWFHTPHLPVVAGKEWTEAYHTLGAYHQHYYGSISALDHQVGRLRSFLQSRELKQNTMLWFCSDNGPEGQSFKAPGSAWPLQGRKRSLHEGGIRVPAFMVWPGKVHSGQRTSLPVMTSDYLPTLLDILEVSLPARPMDGMSLRPLLEGGTGHPVDAIEQREIGFQFGRQTAWMRGSLKYYSPDGGKTDYLYDLNHDEQESINLAETQTAQLQKMKDALRAWQFSCSQSAEGLDY